MTLANTPRRMKSQDSIPASSSPAWSLVILRIPKPHCSCLARPVGYTISTDIKALCLIQVDLDRPSLSHHWPQLHTNADSIPRHSAFDACVLDIFEGHTEAVPAFTRRGREATSSRREPSGPILAGGRGWHCARSKKEHQGKGRELKTGTNRRTGITFSCCYIMSLKLKLAQLAGELYAENGFGTPCVLLMLWNVPDVGVPWESRCLKERWGHGHLSHIDQGLSLVPISLK